MVEAKYDQQYKMYNTIMLFARALMIGLGKKWVN